ncbi:MULTISPECIES: serine/threonine-protein kinase [Trichocoleus]|uniref:Serine/threonine protein kinase n=1 Tax=Trichocoleus desertorum GB2-A4 TaxID=2933944 RepID=A0ABV0J2W2_9CYAN|nr:serine/threonine-protein kinase [Trichocoleus sp. FACHB-46]MBD1860723.1 serine/threonine protein kinase [Trichocoleus sp. FACHB-46]
MLQADQVLQERYQLKQKLRQNAGRQTWLAEDLQVAPPEPVIIKLLTFGGDMQWDDLKLFEREAQVLKQLNHPRIPKYRDSFSIDDRTLWFGLVQSYIPGGSLKDLLTQGKKFTETEVRKIAVSVLQILIHLHKLNPPVLHRDIKPSNLIWGEDQNIYLVDFGAVQDRAAAEGATFTVVGTYGYAPMEQFGGRTVPASDLYALGATLVHLLTSVAPADLPQSDLTIEFRDRTNASSHLVSWIEKLVEPSLKRRFSQAQQALEALESGTLTHTANLKSHSSTLSHIANSKSHPPVGTRVKVQRSRHELVITIPPKKQPFWKAPRAEAQDFAIIFIGFSLVSLLAVFGSSFFPASIGFSFFAVSISFVYAAFFCFYLIRVYTHQRIVINQNQFSVQIFVLNDCIGQRQGSSKDILDVFQSVQVARDDRVGKEIITIQTSTQCYSFGLGLSAMECLWIAQEIRSWLALERQ